MRRSLPFVLFAIAALTALWLSAQPDRGRPGAARENAEKAADVAAGPPGGSSGTWPPPTGHELPKPGPSVASRGVEGSDGLASDPAGSASRGAREGTGVEDLPAPRIGDRAEGAHVVTVNEGTRDPQQVAVGGRPAPPIPVIAGVPAPAPASGPAPAPDESPRAPAPPAAPAEPPPVVADQAVPPTVDPTLPPPVQKVEGDRIEDNKTKVGGWTSSATH